jgi:hypothetical protein
MNNKLEIINQDGWRREYPLEKGIIHIGSAATNDIVLPDRYGGGVAPLQAQLIIGANGHPVFKLINLGEADITVKGASESVLAPRSVLDLTDGLQFKLGEFTLVFHLAHQADAGAAGKSRAIGLKLEMPNTHLAPNRTLEGVVTVANLGQRPGVRFDLELEGLEPDCYDMAPGPLLSSGAEKEVLFRLHHRGHKPAAGEWRIVIRASALHAYPGEQALVSQIITILPFYQHQLRLLPGKGINPLPPTEIKSGLNSPKNIIAEPGATKSLLTTDDGWNLTEKTEVSALKIKAVEPASPGTANQPPAISAAAENRDWWVEPEATLPPAVVQAPPSPEIEAWWSPDEVKNASPLQSEPAAAAPEPAHPEPVEPEQVEAETETPAPVPAETAVEPAAETAGQGNTAAGPDPSPYPNEYRADEAIADPPSPEAQPHSPTETGVENWWGEANQAQPNPAKPAQSLKLKANLVPVKQSPEPEEEADW